MLYWPSGGPLLPAKAAVSPRNSASTPPTASAISRPARAVCCPRGSVRKVISAASPHRIAPIRYAQTEAVGEGLVDLLAGADQVRGALRGERDQDRQAEAAAHLPRGVHEP